jgi:hypothetical protein
VQDISDFTQRLFMNRPSRESAVEVWDQANGASEVLSVTFGIGQSATEDLIMADGAELRSAVDQNHHIFIAYVIKYGEKWSV